MEKNEELTLAEPPINEAGCQVTSYIEYTEIPQSMTN